MGTIMQKKDRVCSTFDIFENKNHLIEMARSMVELVELYMTFHDLIVW